MLKIGEFSQLGRVSVRMLRHYDSLGVLQPVHVDYLSGYRYYAVEQLPRLNRVLALRDLGLTLDQISRLLERDDLPAAELRGMLMMRQVGLEKELREGQERLARVEARLRQIERENEPSPYEVVTKELPASRVASVRAVVPLLSDMPTYRCAFYDELYGWLEEHGVPNSGPELAVYHNPEFSDHDIDMEAAVVVGASVPDDLESERFPEVRTSLRTLPAAPVAASVVHRGSPWDLPDAIRALFAWIGENDYSVAGPYREVHLFWRENELAEEPGGLDSIVAEMQLPISRNTPNGSRAGS